MVNTRQILNTLKTKRGINTDKELAEDMGIKYGALTNWIARDSIQYEPIINYAMVHNIDLNELFSGKQSIFNIESTDMDAHVVKLVSEKFVYYSENGGRLLTAPFAADVKEIIAKYDQQADTIISVLKKPSISGSGA